MLHIQRLLVPLALILNIPACDMHMCGDGVSDGDELPTTGRDPSPRDTDTGDPPGVDPTEGPSERVCAPILTDPEAVCGIVCVDEKGIEVVVVCDLLGKDSWSCRWIPREGPIVGELYDERPVWCGGDGQPTP